ncbi:MAG TPA: hypothetical protein VFE37_08485 [Chloroflexota bacterium]|nr:hypothetical protein [Chloroflexota bacterium]
MIRPLASTATDRHLARCVEQAAAHQTRALAWLREARDPASPLSPARRRALLLLALEHLLLARHLLQRARKVAHEPALLAHLAEHLARLQTIVANTERRLDALNVEAGGTGDAAPSASASSVSLSN